VVIGGGNKFIENTVYQRRARYLKSFNKIGCPRALFEGADSCGRDKKHKIVCAARERLAL
jgi:UDP-N-acetylglucosamine enolpyruvyl transferase